MTNFSEKSENINRTQMLETQLANRNSEILMLRRELEEKNSLYNNVITIHTTDTTRLNEMNKLLESATQAIQTLQADLKEQEDTNKKAAINLNKTQMHFAKKLRIYTVAAICFGISSTIIGTTYLKNASSIKTSENSTNISINETSSLAAKPLDIIPSISVDTYQSTPIEKPYETANIKNQWKKILISIREKVFQTSPEIPWEESPIYNDITTPVVITRSQFRDIVSRSLPAAMPSRTNNGIILYSLDPRQLDGSLFEKKLRENEIASSTLCNTASLENKIFTRISIFISDEEDSLECLKNFILSGYISNKVEEISIISLSNDAKFSTSFASESRFLSFQQWDTNWITKVIVGGNEDTSLTTQEIRGNRLAIAARAFAKTSDVRVQVPMHINMPNETIDIPSTTIKYVSFGSFAIIPAYLPAGPIQATRISLQTKQPSGRTILQNLAPNARAVIINGTENTSTTSP